MFVSDPTLDAVLSGLVLTALGLAWVVVLVRISGLRSFSKMTSFDFVTTLAMGSLLAGGAQSETWRQFLQVVTAMAALLIVQWTLARLRSSSDRIERVLQNQPLLLVHDGRFLEDALKASRVSRSDVLAKLRGANVNAVGSVHAVILETTGDISILHGEAAPSRELLEGTRTDP